MCSTVASSPILAVQLAQRALTACNYSKNHLLALSVNVIGSASAGAAQHTTCVDKVPQIPYSFLYVKEGPYQDRPPLRPFRLLPLLTCS